MKKTVKPDLSDSWCLGVFVVRSFFSNLLGLARRLISLGAMGPPPAGLLIESLFVALNTVPAKKVRPVVRANGLDYVRGLAITAFATMDCGVLDGHRLVQEFLLCSFV
jgi:hypothetical protein